MKKQELAIYRNKYSMQYLACRILGLEGKRRFLNVLQQRTAPPGGRIAKNDEGASSQFLGGGSIPTGPTKFLHFTQFMFPFGRNKPFGNN